MQQISGRMIEGVRRDQFMTVLEGNQHGGAKR
jgi:hypothetical protein